MFARESEMRPFVERWMRRNHFDVKHEAYGSEGLPCDLIGVEFDSDKIKLRRALRQHTPISNPERVEVYLRIPNHGNGLTANQIAAIIRKKFDPQNELTGLEWVEFFDRRVDQSLPFLEKNRYLVRSGKLWKKIDGWIPIERKIVAVEMKLSRVANVLMQAERHLRFADESYAALPASVAARVFADQNRWAYAFNQGIGLLSVSTRGCRVLISARRNESQIDDVIRFQLVERFYRDWPKGNSSCTARQPVRAVEEDRQSQEG